MDTGNLSHFRHKPLANPSDDIRVLTLFRREPDDPIQCSLAHHSLQSEPSFAALSYAWGSRLKRRAIQIDGQAFRIRANLYAFLLRARSPRRDLALWADSICIDQRNVEERTKQVDIMRDIYTSAEEVPVWLGEASERSDEVMNFLSDVEYMDTDREVLFQHIDTVGLFDPLMDLCQRPYWSRLWILQEVCLAKQVMVYCGNYAVQWGAFDMVCGGELLENDGDSLPQWMHEDAALSWSAAGRIKYLRDQHALEYLRLEDLIGFTTEFRCTDVRDHVFGLLGLVSGLRKDMDQKWRSEKRFGASYTWDVETLFFKVIDFCRPSHPINFGQTLLRLLEIQPCQLIRKWAALESKEMPLSVKTTAVVYYGITRSLPRKRDSVYDGTLFVNTGLWDSGQSVTWRSLFEVHDYDLVVELQAESVIFIARWQSQEDDERLCHCVGLGFILDTMPEQPDSLHGNGRDCQRELLNYLYSQMPNIPQITIELKDMGDVDMKMMGGR